jgi:bacillithiol biosynthesis deacetylase BshB1
MEKSLVEGVSQPLPEPLDVIAVGAHPDDVEIGCGGTLARLAEQGYRVGIIDLTDGEPTPGSSGPEARLTEARAAAEMLGISQRVTLELPNRKLFDSFEARVLLALEFRRWRPRLVLGLGEKTVMASPDHWQAMQITDAAVFYARLCKWDDQFAKLPPHTIKAQLSYSLAFHRLELPAGPGQVVVDISRTLQKKMSSVRCYASQFPPEKEYLFARLDAAARYLGQAAGFPAGELLTSPRPIGSGDLMATLFG